MSAETIARRSTSIGCATLSIAAANTNGNLRN